MLKFKNRYIVNQDDKELASLEDRFPVLTGNERYAVYINSIFDYMSPNSIREYINAAEQIEAKTIVQAQMKKSFVEQLKQKLHTCLMETDLSYRYEFETSQMRKQIASLQEELTEERKKRLQLENELFELKQSLTESENEPENEYGD